MAILQGSEQRKRLPRRWLAFFLLPASLPLAGAETPQDLDVLESLGSAAISAPSHLESNVTSVGKKVQRASETAAAIFVITPEDIRRSGVTSIADALRLAPGVQVARIDSNRWAISARGFNGG